MVLAREKPFDGIVNSGVLLGVLLHAGSLQRHRRTPVSLALWYIGRSPGRMIKLDVLAKTSGIAVSLAPKQLAPAQNNKLALLVVRPSTTGIPGLRSASAKRPLLLPG